MGRKRVKQNRSSPTQRQRNYNGRADWLCVTRANGAAVFFNDASANGKPQSVPFSLN